MSFFNKTEQSLSLFWQNFLFLYMNPISYLKETKNITHFLLLKSHPHWLFLCSFSLWITLQSSNFCQWSNFPLILCHANFSIAFLLKCVSDFTVNVFFLPEKELFSWTYLPKKAPQRTKILISPVWNKVFKNLRHFLSSYI